LLRSRHIRFFTPEKNASTEGWVTTMNGILATDAVTFVPGHGDVQMKADLQKRLADTKARREQIKAAATPGKSLDEVRQAINEQPPAARPGRGPNIADFTSIYYDELAKK
jgi:hypothetical protein